MLDAALADTVVDAHASSDSAAFTNHPEEKPQDDHRAAELFKDFVPPASLKSPVSLASPQEHEVPTSGSQPPEIQGEELDPNDSSGEAETSDPSLGGDQAFGVAMLGSTFTPTLDSNSSLEVEVEEDGTVTITEDQLKGDWADTPPEDVYKWVYKEIYGIVIRVQELETRYRTPSNDELRYTVTASPDHGTSKLSGQELAEGQSFTQQDIANGLVTYSHDGSESYHDHFKFTLTDTGDPNAVPLADQTFNFAINNVNDAPSLRNNHISTLTEGWSTPIPPSMLQAVDAEDDAVDLTYLITSAPKYGTLLLNGQAIGFGDTFTQADIDSYQLSYKNDGSEKSSDEFKFTLTDSGDPPAGWSAVSTHLDLM